jgi:serine/threonine-protein kinase
MSPPTQIDSQTFLKRVRSSGLVTDGELREAVKDLPETNRGKVVARALVQRGLLTKFQAQLLLANRTTGFFLGQYRILDQLGQGGMGRVYKAMHTSMGRVVALKVLAPQHVKTPKARELFKREVRAAGTLAHPNIVTAYDASFADGRYYLVMEYVDGPNLEQLVRDRGPLPAGLACELARQVALGLQHAHEKGMVHRDVKPSNLLVQTPGGGPCVVKILDFGLARLHTPAAGLPTDGTILTPDNTVMGTPDYLSPEQSRSLHDVDIRSDLYSLGCTLYFLLTGSVPFVGGNTLTKIIRHASEEAVPVEEIRLDVPAAVAALVRKLMAKDPAGRFQTPAEVAAALAPLAAAGAVERPALVRAPAPSDPGSSTNLTPMDAVPAVGEVATLPPDLSPTAMSAEEEFVQSVRQAERARGRLWRWVLLWGAVLAGVAAGALGLLAHFG